MLRRAEGRMTTMQPFAEPSQPHGPAMSEFEILADELGAVAGQIERESRLKVGTCISDLERRDAERELRMLRLEQELRDKASAVKDGANGTDGINGVNGVNGVDGRDGRDGRDAEIPPVPDDVAAMVTRALMFAAQPMPTPERVAPDKPELHVSIQNNIPRKGVERTVVTKHDDKGRILEFQRVEE